MLSASINWTLLGAAAVAILGIRGALGGFNNTMWELTELERDRRPAGRVASIEALVSGRSPTRSGASRQEFRTMFSRAAGDEIHRIVQPIPGHLDLAAARADRRRLRAGA